MFLRKINDIIISNNTITVIRNVEENIIELESQIKQLDYTGQGESIDEEIENSKIPPFIQVFYYLYFKNLKLPTEKEFYETYISWLGGLKNGVVIYLDLELNPIGIRNRLKRTYPSLIRDIHFLYLLDQSKKFEKVEYSMAKDYYNGLDIKIVYKGRELFISLFIDTKRSRFYKKKKTDRHDYSQVEEIEFNASFSSLSKFGNIYLLNNNHILLLEEMINLKD